MALALPPAIIKAMPPTLSVTPFLINAPHARTDLHLGHIAQVNRRCRAFTDDDAAQVILAFDKADAADQELLGILRQHAAARIGIVARHGLIDLGHADIIVAQLVGVDQDLILLGKAALRIDFRHARNRAQQRAHHPVLNGPTLGQFLRLNTALPSPGLSSVY
jgi:hypothetical protein